MADSVRERILQNVGEVLALATIANGCNTDIGDNVLRSRVIGDISELPAVAFAGLPSVPADSQYMSIDSFIMPLQISGGASIVQSTDRSTNVENIAILGEAILADIQEAVGLIDLDDPNAVITKIMFDGGIDQQPETMDNDAAVIAAVQYSIYFDTVGDDPYTQV